MNKTILMGRLTKDPEIRYAGSNNTAVVNFTLAVNRQFVKQGEEKQADFIPIVAWSKTAEFCAKYFSKGQQVAVAGRIQTRTWDDKDGKKVYITEVIAEEVHFADSKKTEPRDIGDMQPKGNNAPDTTFTDDDSGDDLPF